jgi:hypothetical protein
MSLVDRGSYYPGRVFSCMIEYRTTTLRPLFIQSQKACSRKFALRTLDGADVTPTYSAGREAGVS